MSYEFPTKLMLPGEKVDLRTKVEGDYLHLNFGFSEGIKDHVKTMDGSRWDPDTKSWKVKNIQRNYFQLDYLAGRNPYQHWDQPLVDFTSSRSLYDHQQMLARHALTVRQCIWAAEMGTGKTLAAIEVMEHVNFKDWFYIAPKTVLSAVRLEMRKWNCRVEPEFYSYDSLKSLLTNWAGGARPPRGVIFDECSRVKTPTAQRSLAAKHLADSMRAAYGYDAFVIMMSGTPAPKSPLDWWMQAEIACPGYLLEGNIEKFRQRLCVMEKRENNVAGGMYPHMVDWRTDPKRCRKCGQYEGHELHAPDAVRRKESREHHYYITGRNEIEFLYRRLKGLVTVLFKKDCLDLPEKTYEVIEVQPSQSALNAMMLLTASCSSVIEAMTLTRELSDGFQYQQTADGKECCPLCHGNKIVQEHVAKEDTTDQAIQEASVTGDWPKDLFSVVEVACYKCGGEGEVTRYVRTIEEVPCPKDDVILDKLDQHEDDGRLVIYAGFTGSVDRLCKLVKKAGWEWIRIAAGSTTNSYSFDPIRFDEMLQHFAEGQKTHPKLVIVANPASGGLGLNLTAADEIVYFSNSFKGEDRWQSEDRLHRIGMRGCKITDIDHLPTDKYVRANVQKKKDLQDTTMGQLKAALEDVAVELV